MNYFIMNFTGDDKIFKNYITFAYGFQYQEDRNVCFHKIYPQNTKIFNIEALNHQGDVVRDLSLFPKKKMPPFCKISDVFLVREDIFKADLFADLQGIEFLYAEVLGNFPFKYQVLSFKNVLDCIDFQQSIRAEFDFFSTLVIDKEKIPLGLNGFFLSGWDKFGGFRCIVDETLKNKLLMLKDLDKFIKFKEV